MKKISPKLFLAHHTYTISEIAKICGRSKRTVMRWIGNGLAPIAPSSKPLLFLGSSIRDHLKRSSKKGRFKLTKSDQFPCWKCNGPTTSMKKNVYSIGSIRYGICKKCHTNVCRTIGKKGVKIRGP